MNIVDQNGTVRLSLCIWVENWNDEVVIKLMDSKGNDPISLVVDQFDVSVLCICEFRNVIRL